MLQLIFFPHADLGNLLDKPWRNILWTAEYVEIFVYHLSTMLPNFTVKCTISLYLNFECKEQLNRS